MSPERFAEILERELDMPTPPTALRILQKKLTKQLDFHQGRLAYWTGSESDYTTWTTEALTKEFEAHCSIPLHQLSREALLQKLSAMRQESATYQRETIARLCVEIAQVEQMQALLAPTQSPGQEEAGTSV
jgi:hypothetical protein